MYRLFQTHHARKSIPLPDLWDLQVPGKEKTKIPVPCCVETLPGYRRYKGPCTLKALKCFSGNVRLTFKGVGHTANVYLDDIKLGSHYGSYGEFSFLLKDLKHQEHCIRVEADNSYSEASALHVENDYYSYLGITRPVILEQLDKAYLKWMHITPIYENSSWKLAIHVCLENILDESLELSLRLLVSDTDELLTETSDTISQTSIPVRLAANETKEFCCTLDCPQVEAYLPQHPIMYFVHGQLYEKGSLASQEGKPIDDLIERFGFREIKISGKQILFNGEPLKLKGFNRHEDYAEFGSAIPLSAMYQDIMLIKETGANCVRTSHYPNDERFLDLCDENGLLVWEEAHGRGLYENQMRNPHFMEQSRLTVSEMITWHFNHPSIYVWGLLNECASETEYGRQCYEELIGQIRSMDPSRPVTFASCRYYNDICLDLVDIVSYNIYPKWYFEQPCTEYIQNCLDYIHSHGGATKPFIISEIGAGAIYGYRNDIHCKWSEEYQVEALEEQIAAAMEHPECTGVLIWQFADCRVDEGWCMQRPKTQNNKGILDIYRRKKLSFAKVSELFHRY